MEDYIVHVKRSSPILLRKPARLAGGFNRPLVVCPEDQKKTQRLFEETVTEVQTILKEHGGKVHQPMNHCMAMSIQASIEAVQRIQSLKNVERVQHNNAHYTASNTPA